MPSPGNQTQATLVGGLCGRQMLNHCTIPAPPEHFHLHFVHWLTCFSSFLFVYKLYAAINCDKQTIIILYYFGFVKQHEEASVQMFDYMMKVNNLLPSFTQYNLTEGDVVFIKELIAGTALDTTGSQVNSLVARVSLKREGLVDHCLHHLSSCLLSIPFTPTSCSPYCSLGRTTGA